MNPEPNNPNRQRIIIVGGGIIIIGLIAFFAYKQNKSLSQIPVSTVNQTATTTEPQKADFGTNKPTDFPTNIPTEVGAKLEQSYSLNYENQKQLTIVFLSTKTVKENYALYSDFLKLKGWKVSNKYESPKLSSLYATKESNDINVTISENTTGTSTKSQVSISVLKK